MPYEGSYFECDEKDDHWVIPVSQQHAHTTQSADIPADGGGYYPMPTVAYGEVNYAEDLESCVGGPVHHPDTIETPEGGGDGGGCGWVLVVFIVFTVFLMFADFL